MPFSNQSRQKINFKEAKGRKSASQRVKFSSSGPGDSGVEITFLNLQSKVYIGKDEKFILEKAVKEIFLAQGKKYSGELNFCLVDDKKICELNSKYLGIDEPTDVIAFNNSEKSRRINADIAISSDTAARNAKAYNTLPFSEIVLYAVHGALHILGYDDDCRKNSLLMRRKERLICRKILGGFR